ncbi:MAG: hypothetical protein LBB72_08245 [Spirochaetaceae bacterium]|jgi:hypothetical protein|nr:hypothetical protein [Spirochaetaceae bacterium]
MKKFILAGLLLFAGTFALYAQNLPSIRIVNNTGFSIYYIFVSPSESDDWGDELLGDDYLEDGDYITVRLSQPLSRTNVYDFRVEDEDEDLYFKWEVTVTNNARIVFTLDDLYIEDD